MHPDGFNIGINLGKCAGAGVVDHLHIHIVPRWNGDTNFMPVTAATKVMPMTLPAVFRALKRAGSAR
jgi:ATP adenylyltransferase